MPRFRRILCAIDFSDHSPVVAEFALALARCSDAGLTVFYAAPSFDQYLSFDIPLSRIEDLVDGILGGARDRMRSFVQERFPDYPVTQRVTIGYPAQEILIQARGIQADLIVMGTHGRVGIDRVIFGSVAEKVVKMSSCPVLTVRPKAIRE